MNLDRKSFMSLDWSDSVTIGGAHFVRDSKNQCWRRRYRSGREVVVDFQALNFAAADPRRETQFHKAVRKVLEST